ncbi:MAG: hypothetical protein WCG45_05885 [bacterium]
MQVSDMLGVPLDKESKKAVESLQEELKQYSWLLDIQCNPIDKYLIVMVSSKGDYVRPFGYSKFLPKEWNGYKIYSHVK